LKNEFPRESYTIITKTGKYGGKVKDHVYDPEVTKKSVERSLKRFNTDYLDVVCESVLPGEVC
jgi:aryl-alcohol dehydrogenase-like predicted oxidoreductase